MAIKDPEKKKNKPSKTKETEIEKLQAKLAELQVEKDELFAKMQRVSADYDNFQKRSVRQIADSITYEKEKLIKSLLPAMDNFEHTLQNADPAGDIEVLIKGIEIIYSQMLDILKSHNVEQIDSSDQKFEPSLHQAMMQRTDPDKEDGIILEEFQKGYKLNDRVIRPCKVIVNKLPTQEQAEMQEDTNSTGSKEPDSKDTE